MFRVTDVTDVSTVYTVQLNGVEWDAKIIPVGDRLAVMSNGVEVASLSRDVTCLFDGVTLVIIDVETEFCQQDVPADLDLTNCF